MDAPAGSLWRSNSWESPLSLAQWSKKDFLFKLSVRPVWCGGSPLVLLCLLLAGSLWHEGAYNRAFQCMEVAYPLLYNCINGESFLQKKIPFFKCPARLVLVVLLELLLLFINVGMCWYDIIRGRSDSLPRVPHHHHTSS